MVESTNPPNSSRPLMPVALVASAIILAGGLIAAAIVFSAGSRSQSTAQIAGGIVGPATPSPARPEAPKDIVVRPVTNDDHVRGAPDAPITLIEFSDTECPFCKRFHPTMQQLVKEYAGKVRWVYRHFPLTQIHSKAPKEAEALECAGEQGKFWEYTDRLFEVTPSNDGLDASELPKIAAHVKLDANKFQTCLDSNKFAQHVEDDFNDGVGAGVSGTPTTIVIDQKGNKVPVVGAQPYAAVKQVIEQLLQ